MTGAIFFATRGTRLRISGHVRRSERAQRDWTGDRREFGPTDWTGDQREVIGRNGTLASPAALASATAVSETTGAG